MYNSFTGVSLKKSFLISMWFAITVRGWKLFEKNKPGRGDGYSGTKSI